MPYLTYLYEYTKHSFINASRILVSRLFLQKKAIRSCREHLDKQVEQNFARAEKEKREAEILRAEARDRLTQHEAHQAELKQVTRKKLLVRACVCVYILTADFNFIVRFDFHFYGTV